ncbi:MAG: AAA family ATPase [Sulfurimonas sp.]|jgi:hypothetical protein
MANNKSSPETGLAGDSLSLFGTGLIPFALSNIGNPKVTKFVSHGLAVGICAKMIWGFIRSKQNQDKYTTINIHEGSVWFDYVIRWMSKVKVEYQGSEFEFIDLDNIKNSGDKLCSPDSVQLSNQEKKHGFDFMPSSNCKVFVNGIEVVVILERMNRDNNNVRWAKDKFIIKVKSKDELELRRVFAQIEDLGHIKVQHPRTIVYTYHWNWRQTKKIYKIKDVVLPNGDFEKLKKYFADFLSNREFYERTNTPYRASALLYGRSGSGKSTTVEAIATHFGLDVYVISLSEMTDDKFLTAVNEIPDNGILLLEDVDCVLADERKTEGTGVSFSGLLNVLDSIICKDGRITFQSTNYIDKIDPAQIRAGRADYHLEFFDATFEQIVDLAERFGYNEKEARGLAEKWAPEKIPMCEVQSRLKQLFNKEKQVELTK